MRQGDDQLGPFLLSLAVHGVFVAGLWAATLNCETWNGAVARLALPEFLSMTCVKPLNLEGPVIEAMLVDYSPPKTTRASVPRMRPQPPKPQPPKPEVETPPPPLPPAPPRAEDTIDRERVARDGELPALDEQREQEERRKREQVELETLERLSEMERERQKQLEDIRRLREDAQRNRELEQQRLAQLEDAQRTDRVDRQREDERQRIEELAQREDAQRAGTGGTDNDLSGRYVLALQQVVTQNWLRPDTARGGLQCTVRIVQLPGGEVIDASVVPPCNGDPLTQRSLEAAVMRAQPLPYQGYESVFQRTIDFIFRYDG